MSAQGHHGNTPATRRKVWDHVQSIAHARLRVAIIYYLRWFVTWSMVCHTWFVTWSYIVHGLSHDHTWFVTWSMIITWSCMIVTRSCMTVTCTCDKCEVIGSQTTWRRDMLAMPVSCRATMGKRPASLVPGKLVSNSCDNESISLRTLPSRSCLGNKESKNWASFQDSDLP